MQNSKYDISTTKQMNEEHATTEHRHTFVTVATHPVYGFVIAINFLTSYIF